VVLAKPGADRSGQSRHRESGAVTVSGGQLPPLAQDGADPAVGRRAPALSGTDFEGRAVASAAKVKPQVLLFLAHWCPHCRNEVPAIASWLAREGMPAGVSLMSVATATDDARPNYPPSAWLQREHWPLPVLLDDSSGTAANAYGLTGFPFFVFVNADGTVAGRSAGELPVEDLKARIEELRASRPATESTSVVTT
jgi:thiol-disulfide isomerase/thioredoxin